MERAELKAWLRASGAAVEREDRVFLCDPNGTAAERAAVERRMGETEMNEHPGGEGWLCVRTGGSGGTVKFARHDEKTLGAAVRGFCAHFGIDRVNAVGLLPLHHVSGLMAAVRCATTGGEHVAWDWKRLEAGDAPALKQQKGGWVVSLVPTQLQRLLASRQTAEWLRGFRVIFVGGGPLWPELADEAARARLPVSISYGLTETAAMVAALRPEEFLAGARNCCIALPHVRIEIGPEGVVRVAGEAVFRGYWPEWDDTREFTTEDLGRIDEHGRLHILGRHDAMIITGGKKVQPLDVEMALRASGEFEDVAVIGVPDREWGEIVVACYPIEVARTSPPDMERAVAGLAAYQRPKRFVAIATWPRNSQGKVNRAALREAAIRVVTPDSGRMV